MDDSRIDSSELKGLAPAGAGLPRGRALLLRYAAFPLLKRLVSFERALSHFEKEGRRAAALCEGLSRERLFGRVMVPPLFGLEENSRYYSPAMVLMHLLIVGQALRERIPRLSRGERPDKEVRIEEYKPYTDIPEDIVKRYRRFVEGFRLTLLENLDDIHAPHRYEHPWFGPLNPKEWMVMGAIHQTVHRRQIEAILTHSGASATQGTEKSKKKAVQ